MTRSTFDTINATSTIMDVNDDHEWTRVITTIDTKVRRKMRASTMDNDRADGGRG